MKTAPRLISRLSPYSGGETLEPSHLGTDILWQRRKTIFGQIVSWLEGNQPLWYLHGASENDLKSKIADC